MTTINNEVDAHTGHYQHTSNIPTDEQIQDPQFCRRRFAEMARELDNAYRRIRDLARDNARMEARLTQATPKPEVRASMTVRGTGMRPVLANVDGRAVVIVAPPGGFDDPDQVWGQVVQHYGDEAAQ